MLYHDFTSRGYVKLYLEEGRVKVEIKTDDNPRAILDNYDEQFNDGRWHSLVLTIAKNSLVLDIDQRPMRTTRLLSMTTGGLYYIAGGKTKDGFVGCMRMISVDGNYLIPSDWKVGRKNSYHSLSLTFKRQICSSRKMNIAAKTKSFSTHAILSIVAIQIHANTVAFVAKIRWNSFVIAKTPDMPALFVTHVSVLKLQNNPTIIQIQLSLLQH